MQSQPNTAIVDASFEEIAPAASNGPRAPYKVDPSKGEHRGDVSSQWMARPADQRFLSLDDLFDKVKARHDASFESRVNTRKLELLASGETRADMHRLRIGFAGSEAGSDIQKVREAAPTNWSFGQLAGLAKAPGSFLRELPSPMVADILNWRLRMAREVEELKLYGGDDQLYAATGPDYGRIPDHEIVSAVQQVAGSGRGERRWKVPGVLNWRTHMYDPEAPVTLDSTTLYGSDRDVFIFLVDDRNPIEVGKLKDGSPDLVFRGFGIQNSEVGSRSLKLFGLHLRAVCFNRNLWGCEEFQEIRINHTRLAPDRWLQQAQPALNAFADGSAMKLIETVQKAKAAKLADDDDEVLAFLQARKFSKKSAQSLMDQYLQDEGQPVRSAWDVGNAITRFAQTASNTDDRLDMELAAKAIVDKVL